MFTRIQQYIDDRKQRRERATARREKFQARQNERDAILYARFEEISELPMHAARAQTFDLLDNTDLCDLKPALGKSIPLEDQLAPSIRELFSKYSTIRDPSGTFELGVTWIERLKRTPPFIQIGLRRAAPVAVMPGDERIFVIERQRPVDAGGSYRNVYDFLLTFAALQDVFLADE